MAAKMFVVLVNDNSWRQVRTGTPRAAFVPIINVAARIIIDIRAGIIIVIVISFCSRRGNGGNAAGENQCAASQKNPCARTAQPLR